MKNKYKYTLITFLFAVNSLFSQIKDTTVIEEIFVHTDKHIYNVGENIWFKVYIKTYDSKVFSKNARVELLSPDNKLFDSRIIKLTAKNSGEGYFILKDSVPGGHYLLRAYTQNMRNIPENRMFLKHIYIENPKRYFYTKEYKNNVKKLKRKRNKINISITPENGYIAENLNNRIYISVKTRENKALPAECVLYENKKEIKTFNLKEGYGSFTFISGKEKKYKLKVKTEKKKATIKIPKAIKALYTISQKRLEKENIVFEVNKSNTITAESEFNKVIIKAEFEEKEIASKEYYLKDYVNEIKFPIENPPTGFIKYSLCDIYDRKYSEIYFRQYIDISFFPVSKEEFKNDSCSLKIKKIEDGNYSLSIVSSDSLPRYANNKISNWIKVNSKALNPFTYEHRDNSEIIKNTYSPKTKSSENFSDSEDLSITGKIMKVYLKQPAEYAHVYLYILNKFNERFATRADEKGNFKFTNLNYEDTMEIVLESRNHAGKKRYLIIPDEYNPPETPELILSDYTSEYKKVKKASDNYYENFDYEAEDRKYKQPGKLHSNADRRLNFEEMNTSGYTDVLQVLESYVHGISKNGMSKLRGPHSINLSSEPLYLVDDVPVDKGALATMNPEDVSYVEIIKSSGNAAVYGSRGGNGVVAVYTKQGYHIITGELEMKILGYCKNKEFEADFSTKNKHKTYYWLPDCAPDNNSEINVKFKLPPKTKSFKIVLQGFTKNGEPVYYEKHVPDEIQP